MPRPPKISYSFDPNNICWGIPVMTFLIMRCKAREAQTVGSPHDACQ
jgi:hypothetical protein